jgi:hypothetical protein
LYALPSQADEVAYVAKQLGLSTILAICQILDHTAARMRLSMHGSTLVEMAVVRICQLDELDDLATMIAELRGTSDGTPVSSSGQRGSTAGTATGGSLSAALAASTPKPAPPAKKNDEPRPSVSSDRPSVALRNDPPHVERAEVEISREMPFPSIDEAPISLPASQSSLREVNSVVAVAEPSDPPVTTDSVLAQFQRAMAGGSAPRPPAPPRPSRREQAAKIAEQPFVKRAMELFDVAPDKVRYSPPDDSPQ